MPEKPRSVPGKPKNFAVPASPFNLIKLELGIILVVGLLWVLIVGVVVNSPALQFVLFVVYGFGAMAWLVTRTSRVLQQHTSNAHERDDG